MIADVADHVPAVEERRHGEQELRAAPEEADAARPAHLVAGDGDEVGAERLHVDRAVRCRLRRVDDADRALVVGPGGEPRNVVDGAERVRDETRRDDLDVAPGERVERVELQLARVVERDHLEVRPGAAGDRLPGHEVRVVLELGDEHEVAGAEVVEPPGVGDQVQGLGRVADEDDLPHRRRVDERARLLARSLEGRRRALAELVDAAMDVRVRRLVEVRHRVEHLPRLLRARGRVEVGERLAVEVLLEDREVGAELGGVERRRDLNGHVSTVPSRLPEAAGRRAATIVARLCIVL